MLKKQEKNLVPGWGSGLFGWRGRGSNNSGTVYGAVFELLTLNCRAIPTSLL